jgi:hypothetical protein
MRVACVLYGQPRDYIKGYNNIMQFYKNQENVIIDFFYHCWVLNPGEEYKISPWRNIDKNTLCYTENIEESIKKLYNPICYEYELQKTFDATKYKNTIAYNNTKHRQVHVNNISNVLSQMYSRNKARNLLDTYIKNTNTCYEFVIMPRFDMPAMPNLKLIDLDNSKTYVADIHRPRNIIPDCNFIIPTKSFLEWFNIYEELTDILDNENLLKNIRSLGETIYINAEEILLAKYILQHNNLDNIVYVKGGCI